MNNCLRRALAFVLLMAVAFSLCSCKKEPTIQVRARCAPSLFILWGDGIFFLT